MYPNFCKVKVGNKNLSAFCERTLNHGSYVPEKVQNYAKERVQRKKNTTEHFVFTFATLNLHYTVKEDLVHNGPAI